ncbi:hypothetical protein ES703_106517 [subsurface metagenome]
MQPQVRLIFPIFNRAWPVFVNLNSQLFFVPRPTSPKSQTVFSKEILGDRFLALGAGFAEIPVGSGAWITLAGDSPTFSTMAATADCCRQPIPNERIRLTKANIRTN